MTRLPDFIVLGQGKSGTSLLYRLFEANPHIGMPRRKELRFFTWQNRRPFKWYEKQFAHIDDSVRRVGEVAPGYLKPKSMRMIRDTLGVDMQLIFILRRPSEQTYSRYLQNLCARGKGAPFEESLRTIHIKYDRIVRGIGTCYQIFGRDQVLSLSYELNVKGAGDYEQQICDFLGLPFENHAAHLWDGKRVNPGVVPRYLYGGADGQEIEVDGTTYHIPARELVLCAKKRSSKRWENAPEDDVAHALESQKNWTTTLEEPLLSKMHEELDLPIADELERRYGFDMDHWRTPPKPIAYRPAPPPRELAVTP